MNTYFYDCSLNREQIITQFKEDIENEKEITFRNITFPTENDAIEYLNDISNVFEAVAIKYLEPLKKFEESDIYQELTDNINQAIKNYLEFPKSMLLKLSEQKSGTKSCSVCKTSVNRDYYVKKTEKRFLNIVETAEKMELDIEDFFEFKMKAISCPICDDKKFIVSETDENKLNSLRKKITDAEKKFKEEELGFKIKSGEKTVCLIGYND